MEGIIVPHPGWKRILDADRDEFRRRQLRAAIRNDPDTAVAALRKLKYDVREPDLAPSDPAQNVVDISKRPRNLFSRKGKP